MRSWHGIPSPFGKWHTRGRSVPVLILDEDGNAIVDAETGALWITYTDDIDED
jgi:hypothetical protein